ncbi:MAG: prephenate dehydrogenase/arogenate dehydrogenase family protein [Halorientalis sp.]
MKLLVVGAGAMGRWFAETVADDGTEFTDIAFADADADAATAAGASLDHGRAVDLETNEQFEVVCIAVPIPVAVDAIATHADRATRALVDVTGVAADPVAAMADHAPDRERLSLHPLFAPENAPGNVAAVVDEAGPVTDAIMATLRGAGNRVFQTTAEDHDTAMETVQAQAHAAILSFGMAAANVPDEFQTPISEGLFDLVAQVTDGDPRVYADIQAAFDGADDVAQAAARLADADATEFETLYDQVTEKR